MRTGQIIWTNLQDTVKPGTNISGSLKHESAKGSNIKRNSVPMENKKSNKTVAADNLEEQGYQYKHFF